MAHCHVIKNQNANTEYKIFATDAQIDCAIETQKSQNMKTAGELRRTTGVIYLSLNS